jgi:hypothetical protein
MDRFDCGGVIIEPMREGGFVERTVGHREHYFKPFGILGREAVAVEPKKELADDRGDPFVSIDEAVVLGKAVAVCSRTPGDFRVFLAIVDIPGAR